MVTARKHNRKFVPFQLLHTVDSCHPVPTAALFGQQYYSQQQGRLDKQTDTGSNSFDQSHIYWQLFGNGEVADTEKTAPFPRHGKYQSVTNVCQS